MRTSRHDVLRQTRAPPWTNRTERMRSLNRRRRPATLCRESCRRTMPRRAPGSERPARLPLRSAGTAKAYRGRRSRASSADRCVDRRRPGRAAHAERARETFAHVERDDLVVRPMNDQHGNLDRRSLRQRNRCRSQERRTNGSIRRPISRIEVNGEISTSRAPRPRLAISGDAGPQRLSEQDTQIRRRRHALCAATRARSPRRRKRLFRRRPARDAVARILDREHPHAQRAQQARSSGSSPPRSSPLPWK